MPVRRGEPNRQKQKDRLAQKAMKNLFAINIKIRESRTIDKERARLSRQGNFRGGLEGHVSVDRQGASERQGRRRENRHREWNDQGTAVEKSIYSSRRFI